MTERTLCQGKKLATPLHCILVALNSRFVHSSLALFYLRQELLAHCPGLRVSLLQATINDGYYETLLDITETSPDMVFLSANIWNSDRIESLVADINLCLPESQVVVGGPQAEILRERLSELSCTVVVGEIEAVAPSFFVDLMEKRLQPFYQGSFLGQRIGRLQSPFLDDDFASHLKNRQIYYESSRGCPYQCSYCLSAAERGVFHKEIEQVKDELRLILRHQPKVLRFIDRTFNDRPKRALAIWEFLLEEGGETLFHFEIAPERFTEEMFQLLKEVPEGRFQFEIGIQSTHRPTLKAIHRSGDLPAIHAIIKRLAAIGTIHLHVDLILGLPYETKESFEQSFRDVFAMGAHYIQMGLLKILPGTPIAQEADTHQYRWSQRPPYAVLANRWMDHRCLGRMYRFCECVEKFHNNRYFVSFWQYLRLRNEDVAVFFHRLLEIGMVRQLFLRAPTQEFLCELLVAVCQTRDDFPGIKEMLRYDWLRCGLKKLPECLCFQDGQEDLLATRNYLYTVLPEALEGVFERRQRNVFFRTSVFFKLGVEGCRCLGIESEHEVRVAVLNDREETVFRHNRVIVFGKKPFVRGNLVFSLRKSD